jgi:glucose/arabinose dehydrogenase
LKLMTQILTCSLAASAGMAVLAFSGPQGPNAAFHNAPAAEKNLKNPYQGAPSPKAKSMYQFRCGKCHGDNGDGSGNIPALARGPAQSATDGEIFWYITKGDQANGMPSWAAIPRQQRWQIVAYVKTLGSLQAAADTKAASDSPSPSITNADDLKLPRPTPPFTDFRYEQPGKVRKITVNDLPAPYATSSAGNAPRVVARPKDAWPQVLPGFKVELYASDLHNPRLTRTAPNGDVFVAETGHNDILVFRGITSDGKPAQSEIFASGLKQPFGINFYPPGPNPNYIYVGNTNAVVRIPYQNGDLKARGPVEHIVDLPWGEGHSTRDVQFSSDGKKMFVSVGSASNVDDSDTSPAEKNRADVLEFNPDGSQMRIYAYGIRNCVGLARRPKTDELWCSTNERDALGDNLVPDYITHLQDGGFYGWPWWYMGGHQDPRHVGKHPELKDKVITPDVVLNPHNASLEMTFYEGSQFPAEYRGDIFASEHGSWNRSVRVGYEVIRVPLHQTGHASGEYEDFMTGFVVDNAHVWGRPVGITTASDGSLLVTDDGSNSIWRISYVGK